MQKYDYYTFRELYDAEIHYAYEPEYGCDLYQEAGVTVAIGFYKLGLSAEGTGAYKTSTFTFDPRIWGKVVAFAEFLQTTKAEKILYVK